MNRHIYILTFTLAIIVISVVSLTIYQLYSTAYEEQKKQLTAIAKSQAKLIESVAHFDSIYSDKDVEGGAIQATLNQISNAYASFEGFGKTGEINIGKLENNNVIFVLQSRLLKENRDSIRTINRPTPVGSSYSIPMQRALMGESGSIVGPDYDNIQVLSAYEPIAGLNYGVVVKIDISEVREPYINAIIISISLAMILVIFGSYIFNIINNRSIRTLKNSEEKHRSLIENINDVILILDKDGVNMWNSPAVKDQFGMNPEDAVGISAIDYAHPDDVERLRETVDYVVKHPGETVFLESLKAITPNGELYYLNDTFKYLPDTPGINGIVVVVHNNTEQINALKKIKEKEERIIKSVNDLKEAQKIAQVGSWELDIIENSLEWSDEIYRIFDLKPQEFEATYEAFLSYIHPDDRDMVNKAYSDSLINKEPYEITHRLKLKNGNIKYVNEKCTTNFDDNGKPLRSNGTIQDITAIKLSEIELKKYKDNLEKMIHEATVELEIKNNKLTKSYLKEKANKDKLEETYSKLKKAQSQMVESEKMASLGQFTAGIAHEINNPINFIGVGIESIEENFIEVFKVLEEYNQINNNNVSGKLAEINNYKKEIQFDSLLKYIQKNTINIKNGVERTSEIIDGLKVFSRTDQDKTSIIDIHKNIEATLVIIRNQYAKRNISIMTNYGEIPKIECFQGKLSQVFTNLIMNSIHAIEDQKKSNTGIITITTKPLNKKEIAINFKDNGKGIPSKIIDKIFEPFFTSKDIGKGTGLGLSISYGIIKMHNGKIKVLSEEGKGTEFEIVLPIKYSPTKIKE